MGKKKIARSNKKKGKARGGGTHTNPAAAKQKKADTSFRTVADNVPTFHSEKAASSVEFGGIYGSYKKCTGDFWEWMKRSLPGTNIVSVNDLSKGADQILEDSVQVLNSDLSLESLDKLPAVVPKEIVESLSNSIELREEFSARYGDKSDNGHKHMISTLRYCKKVLLVSRRILRVAFRHSSEQVKVEDVSKSEVGGRFSALLDEEEEVDELVTDDDVQSRNFPDFEQPTPAEREMSIEDDLINGDDHFQATAMLRSMEDFMAMIDQHYSLLKSYMDGEKVHSGPIIQLVMECAVAVNMATESILSIERALAVDYPYLNSFYRVLALVRLPTLVAEVQKHIPPKKLADSPHLALEFVGDIVECCFHSRGKERVPGVVKKYVKPSGVPHTTLQQLAHKVHTVTQFEVFLAQEERSNPEYLEDCRMAGATPHSWLARSPHIGGERSILNTQNLIQKVMDVVRDKTKLIGIPGFFGEPFDERASRARKIRGDLDEAFASAILPELFEICKRAPFKFLPERSQLLTVLDLLATQLKNRDSPIPVALTFGLHAMLTSIYIVQGRGHLSQIAGSLKSSFHKLFSQLEERSDKGKDPENNPVFYHNVETFKYIVNFAEPVGEVGSREDLALWNPVIGGEYLLYATYMCSIGLGSATVDSMGQLRFALHLYNALKQQGFVTEKDIPLLGGMDDNFKACRAVWVGSRPSKGSYARQFWLSWGKNLAEASRSCMDVDESDQSKLLRNLRPHGMESARQLEEILPEEYSESYRLLVQRNFTDCAADYTLQNVTDEQRDFHKNWLDLMTRVNMTRDSMDEDEDWVLPTNFTEVGCILLEFSNALSKHMGWESIIEHIVLTSSDEVRNGRRVGGKLPKVGGFETSDLNLRQQAMAFFVARFLESIDKANVNQMTEATKVAEFMVSFFSQVPRDRYTFTIDVEGTEPELEGNPLEGSYPLMYNGKSEHSPLLALPHFKYSKAGELVFRLLKPGKRTPVTIDENGDPEGPYPMGIGNKLPKLPNGKFKHIASYSLKELVDLGWDGAMYMSTKGRHEARGIYVPFVPGYDSDSEDEYEPIDVEHGRQAGTVGLPPQDVGAYMVVPKKDDFMKQQMVTLSQGSAFERRFGRK